MTAIEKLQQLIDESNRIVAFTGAGVSTESGIKDFRSEDGLYNEEYDFPPEIILSHSFFMQNPIEFFRFYQNKMLCKGVLPNAAHKKFAELEQAGKLTAVITQNIDGLHQLAGNKTVLELHGSVLRNYCMRCGEFYPVEKMEGPGIPYCDCGGMIKPDVVLYEESLYGDTIEQSIDHLRKADLVIVGGTSLTVYPAAGLLNYTHGKIVLINRGETHINSSAELVITDPIGKTMEQIIIR